MNRACFIVFSALATLHCTAQAQVPDLRPEIKNLTIRLDQTVLPGDVTEGCAASTSGRTLLAFDHTAWNDGPGDLSLGDPGCPDCESTFIPVCSNPLFECSAAGGHNHPHLRNFSAYTVTKRGSLNVELRGHKEGFCLMNSICQPGITPPDGGTCNNLTAGCGDFYPSGLGCQYVDITALKPGKYTLRVELNPLRTITEANYLNNVQTIDFEVCKSPRQPFKTTFGAGDPRDGNKRPFILETTLEFHSASQLKSLKPITTGLSPALLLGNANLPGGIRYIFGYAPNLPPGKVGAGCFPNDGWKKAGPSTWEFRSDSELDPASGCQGFATGGIHSATITKRGKFLDISLRGRVDAYLVPLQSKGGSFSVSWAGSKLSTANDTCAVDVQVKSCSQGGPGRSAVVCK